ncbi:MAG: peptidoglycan DD-metalloendopeptidase family protein [Longicatena sp.]
MKKRNVIFIIAGSLAVVNMNSIFAKSFEGKESEMNAKCAVITTEVMQSECREYKEYLEGKSSNLDKEIKDIQNQIASVKGNMEKVGALIQKNNETIASYEKEIVGIQEIINQSESSIATLNTQISEKTEDIKIRDKQMKERLIEMQAYTGSNNYIDFIMGSSGFADLLRRAEIVGELNTYENDQIAIINTEKKKLDLDKKLVIEQKELLEVQKRGISENKEKVVALNSVKLALQTDYKQQEASLTNQKRTTQMAQASIPKINLSVAEDFDKDDQNQNNNENTNNGGNTNDDGNTNNGGNTNNDGNTNNGGNGETPKPTPPPANNTGFISPLQSGWHYEAGTWAYPGGGGHMGMDFSTGQTTGIPVVAPGDGIILYSQNGCSNGGPLGCGVPWGGGNNTLLLTKKGNTIYAMPFYHLTSATKSAGTRVSQGEVIGYSGNTGNSTGPHTHVEVIRVGDMSMSQAITKYNNTGDLTFGTGWNADSPNACGSAPCRERPENYWL